MQQAASTAAGLDALAGEYTDPTEPDTPLSFYVQNGKLVVEATGQWSILDFDKGQPTPVAVRSKDELQVENGDHTRIAFVRDAAGKVNGAVLNPGPWEQRGVLAQ